MNYITEAWAKLDYMSENHLDEDLRGYFKNQYLKKFLQRVQETNPEVFGRMPEDKRAAKATELALAIAKLDPTFKGRDIENNDEALNKNQGSYFDWLIRLINKGTVTYEAMMRDAHEYYDQLNIFDAMKKRNRIPADKKDIMRLKNLDELMDLIQSLGATSDEEGNVQTSDFKNDVKDIREALKKICKFNNINDIPSEIQTTDDVLELIGESGEWEIWKAKNKYGTMLFDSWGAGAGWCVGGMLGSPRNGEEQAEAATSYYNRYLCGGGNDNYYYCFQRKDRAAKRPDNKYLITLGPKGALPQYGNYQFNNADNRTMYDSSWGGGYGNDAQMAALAKFITENGLVEPVRKHLPDLAALSIVDTLEALQRGEPYNFAGDGKEIPDAYRPFIKEIVFKVDGETVSINPEGHPEYFKAKTIEEMLNIQRCINGEPYVYNGSAVPNYLKEAIEIIHFAEDYRCEAPVPEDEKDKTLAPSSLTGLKNLKTIKLTDKITLFKAYCIRDCGDDYKILIPRFPDRKIKISPYADFIRDHLYYEDAPDKLIFAPKQEQPAEPQEKPAESQDEQQ